jgi:DNA-directed RNA polymerase specialized sigma24 family protein
MTREAFARIYTTHHRRAVEIAERITRSRAAAEDAVQAAALYVLERLADYDTITPSLWYQLVAQRARNAVDRRPSRGNGPLRHELGVGTSADLERYLEEHDTL